MAALFVAVSIEYNRREDKASQTRRLRPVTLRCSAAGRASKGDGRCLAAGRRQRLGRSSYEGRFAAALQYRASGTCPGAAFSALDAATRGPLAAVDGRVYKSEWLENRILLPRRR